MEKGWETVLEDGHHVAALGEVEGGQGPLHDQDLWAHHLAGQGCNIACFRNNIDNSVFECIDKLRIHLIMAMGDVDLANHGVSEFRENTPGDVKYEKTREEARVTSTAPSELAKRQVEGSTSNEFGVRLSRPVPDPTKPITRASL